MDSSKNIQSIEDQRSGPVLKAPPEAWEPLLKLANFATRPLERFLQIEAASGILLLVAAGIAMALANSRWAGAYRHFWHLPVGLKVGSFAVERSIEWVVNDVLMVIFFFLVGLEIRREIHHGELSDRKRATLPAAAALGGMIVPALLYFAIAGANATTRSGWGVPMATDIAFAVGVLALLGKRVPAALRVLLLALAVIDDLGAIVVIALFYSSGIILHSLLIAALGMLGIYAFQAVGIRKKLLYMVPGFFAWLGVYRAGIHPTIAGVIIGLATPVRAWLGPQGFVDDVQAKLSALSEQSISELDGARFASTVREINQARREAISPAENLIETLHPWVAYGIMPLFALANAGVAVDGISFTSASTHVAVGAGVGLIFGKPIGVIAACLLSTKLKIAALPAGLSLRHLVVLGASAGIGFTMALFVAQLAFTNAALLGAAKLGVLAGSAIAAMLGLGLGRVLLPAAPASTVVIAQSADEAESSTEL